MSFGLVLSATFIGAAIGFVCCACLGVNGYHEGFEKGYNKAIDDVIVVVTNWGGKDAKSKESDN